jgi:hypothetical protein
MKGIPWTLDWGKGRRYQLDALCGIEQAAAQGEEDTALHTWV